MKLIDLHNDFLTSLSIKDSINFLFKAKSDGVKTIISSIYTTELNCDVISKIKHYKKFLIQTKIKPKTLIHIEDCGFIKNDADVENLVKIKPFSCGLTWNYENRLAGGAKCESGLSTFGRKVIKEFENRNIIIDLAHLNKKSFYNVMKQSQNKVFCSHAGFSAICDNSRNLDDNQIRQIIKRGGVIGLTFVGNFLNKAGIATFNDVYKNMHYFLENFGEDNLCFGSDFFGTSNTPINLNGYENMVELFEYLTNKGIPKKILAKIYYKNFERFIN